MVGTFSKLNQREEVFFLCQTFERTEEVPKRTLTVKSGTIFLMPLINYISTMPSDGRNEEEISTTAMKKMDSIAIIELSINQIGLRLSPKDFRFRSNAFHVLLPSSNILDLKGGIVTCVSDGYWIMIEAISGPLEISSSATCSSGRTKISAKYFIEIPH